MNTEPHPVQRDWLDPYISLDDASIATRKDWLRLVAHRILDDLGETYPQQPVHFTQTVIIDSVWFTAYRDAGTTPEGQRQVEILGYWPDQLPPGLTDADWHSLPKSRKREGPGRTICSIDIQIVGNGGIKSSRMETCKVINPLGVFAYGQYKG